MSWSELTRTARHRAEGAFRLFWNEKAAAAHTVFYLISAAIFLPLVGGLFIFMKDSADNTSDASAGLDSRAAAALNQITNNPGKVKQEENSYWENKGTGLEIDEIGMKDENSTMLSYEKIDNLQRGGLVAYAGDAFVNYPEFEKALGIGTDRYDLHIRLSPVILDPGNDPYGTKPLKAMKIAYVADIGDHPAGGEPACWVTNDKFTGLSDAAKKEIAALKLLGVDFDDRHYQPAKGLAENDCSYVTGTPPLPTSDSYAVVGNAATIPGDVIADTTRAYGGTAYRERFWTSHFESGSTFRYDAIIFGGGVDMGVMSTDVGDTLKRFVDGGGVVIFMGTTQWQPDFVNYCSSNADCLFRSTGTQQPPTTPDITNQMLTVPNKLSTGMYPETGNMWEICTVAGTNERQGFIPVERWEQATTCAPGQGHQTDFGATTADRFGATGGTVILNRWILDSTVSDQDAAKLMANLLSYGLLRPVYMDYGPEIPVDAAVATAERVMLVKFPTGEFMEVQIVLYLWRAG